MQPKRLVSQLLILLLANLIVKPIWVFGVERGVQLQTGFEAYGIYYTLFSLSLIVSLVADMGASNYNNRFIAQHPKGQTDYISAVLTLKLLLAFLYLFVCLGAGYVLGYAHYFSLLLPLGIYQALTSWQMFLRTNLTSLQLFRAETLISVADKLLLILLLMPLLYGGVFDLQISINLFIYAQLFAMLASVLMCVYLLRNHAHLLTFRFNLPAVWPLIKQIYPLALLGFFMLAYNKIDAIMLERMLPDGAYETGVYAAAYRLFDAFTMVPILFSSLLYPVFSKEIKQTVLIDQLCRVSFKALIIPIIILTITCFFYGRDFMNLLYGQASSVYLVNIFKFLMPALIGVSLSYIFSTLLTANANLAFLNKVAIAGLVINIFLNILLIPAYKALGATYATVITFTVIAALHVYKSYRVFQFKVSKASFLRLFLFTTISIALIWALQFWDLNRWISLIICGFVQMMLAVFTRTFPVLKLISFFNFTLSKSK